MILRAQIAIFSYFKQMNRHTDGQTDGRTDGRTNRWTLFYRDMKTHAKLLVRPCFGLYFMENAIIHRQGFKKLVKM